jgi:tetratricopeptide (TPR) repeat protein
MSETSSRQCPNCEDKERGGDRLISRQDYARHVEWATENYIKIPKLMVSNYDDWLSRGMLGRYLYTAKRYADAIPVLETIVDVKVADPDEGLLWPSSEYEHKAWCLQYLALAIVIERNDYVTALKYMNKALRLADRSKSNFEFVVRGQLWLNRLLFRAKLGRAQESKKEARIRLASIVLEPGRSNSYYFFGYAFLAKMAMEEGNGQQALELFRRGLEAYNLEKPDRELLQEAEDCSDPAEAFRLIWPLVDTPYRIWDESLKVKGVSE